MKTVFIDVDDLWRREQITDLLVPVYNSLCYGHTEQDLEDGRPGPVVTAYAVPNRLGPVKELREEFPWLIFGIHGFEHTPCECQCWTKEMAVAHMERALAMGYDPVFKPPHWVCHREIEEACLQLHIALHHHESYRPVTPGLWCYPGVPGLESGTRHTNLHTHIVKNPATDYIETHPEFRAEKLRKWDEAVDISRVSVVIP